MEGKTGMDMPRAFENEDSDSESTTSSLVDCSIVDNDLDTDIPTSPLRPSTPDQEAEATAVSDSGSSTTKMPPRPKLPPPKRETEIGELLTVPQRMELVGLVTAITDHMRNNVTRTFDHVPQPVCRGADMLPDSFDLRGLKIDTKENAQPLKSRPKKMTHADMYPGMSVFEPNPVSPALENLKKDALAAIRRWQAAVLKRIGELIIAHPHGPNHPPRPGPRAPVRPGRPAAGDAGRAVNEDTQAHIAEADAVLKQLYFPCPTMLANLPMTKRRLILHAMLLLVLSLENYAAYSRTLMMHLATSLNLPPHLVSDDELRVVSGLSQLAAEICTEEIVPIKKSEDTKGNRRWKPDYSVSLGEGGLPGPLLVAGVGSIPGGACVLPRTAAGLLSSMANNSLTVGSLFGIYGTRSAGKVIESYTRDVSDFAYMPLYATPGTEFQGARDVDAEHRRLRLTIGVNGWLTEGDGIGGPWKAFGSQTEAYGLRWEAESLGKMGAALETVTRSAAWSAAKKELGTHHVVASLNDEPWPEPWPASLLKISKIVDNLWGSCIVRADKAGAVLAETILNRIQGERGVTLIGYSLGARVIYTCLMILAERRALGVVENVVLMGMPAPADGRVWSVLRSVVSGRLINVYSEKDYMLAFLIRHGCIQFGIAGLQCVEKQSGVENVNASAMVTNHLRYQYLIGTILKSLGWEDIDTGRVAEREVELKVVEEALDYDKRLRRAADLAAALAAVEAKEKAAAMRAAQAKKENKPPTLKRAGGKRAAKNKKRS